MAIAFLVGGWLIGKELDRRGLPGEVASSMVFWAAVGGIGGSEVVGACCRTAGAAARPDRDDLLRLRLRLVRRPGRRHAGRQLDDPSPAAAVAGGRRLHRAGAGARARHRAHRLPARRRRRLGRGERRAVGDGVSARDRRLAAIRRACACIRRRSTRCSPTSPCSPSSGRCASARIPTARSSGGIWCSPAARASSSSSSASTRRSRSASARRSGSACCWSPSAPGACGRRAARAPARVEPLAAAGASMRRSLAPFALLLLVLGAVAGLQYIGRAPRTGYAAPDFTLPDLQGTPHRLSDSARQGRVPQPVGDLVSALPRGDAEHGGALPAPQGPRLRHARRRRGRRRRRRRRTLRQGDAAHLPRPARPRRNACRRATAPPATRRPSSSTATARW